MKHVPKRTCIGCRGVFGKDAVVRIVAGPAGILVDYRERLPGRAAYVCPTPDCVAKALGKDNLARSLHGKFRMPGADALISQLAAQITEKLRALILMSAKAGKLAAGYSAVHDAVEKDRIFLLLYARDLSDGTREKISTPAASSVPSITFFTRVELGSMLDRGLVGVIGITDKGFSDALWKEIKRLKGLINIS